MKHSISMHPLQSIGWGEFRKKTGIKVITTNGIQITIHKIPHTPWTIGYVPKCPLPDKEMILELTRIGKEEKCIFIQLEPNAPRFTSEEPVPVTSEVAMQRPRLLRGGSLKMFGLRSSFHPLFTKYTFVLDLTKSEEELLKAMHPKTRYNIKVAQKHNVQVIEDNSDKAFATYLRLLNETTKKQRFYAHDEKYHRMMWETLGARNQESGIRNQGKRNKEKNHNSYFMIHNSNKLTAHLLTAKYKNQTLATWILFVFKDALYYPYGASSSEYRQTMASNLMMWEAIKFGKKLGLKKFDMWGSLGPNPDKNDPWYGFHRFKEGYGPTLTEFIGSFDLVINPVLYEIYKILDKVRWTLLKINPFDKLRINAE